MHCLCLRKWKGSKTLSASEDDSKMENVGGVYVNGPGTSVVDAAVENQVSMDEEAEASIREQSADVTESVNASIVDAHMTNPPMYVEYKCGSPTAAVHLVRQNNTSSHPWQDEDDDDDFYQMDHKERGVALIFNHEVFQKRSTQLDDGEWFLETPPRRHGTDKDRDAMQRCLKKYGFDVRDPVADGTTKDVMETLLGVASEDHSDRDCLVVVVLSHGGQKRGQQLIKTSDGEYVVEQLWSFFDANACPSLAGKPKLFFIQACQGQRHNHAAPKPVRDRSREQSRSVFRSADASPERELFDVSTHAIPVLSDILVVNATVQGYFAWRVPKEGSWFIQTLCQKLEKNLARIQKGGQARDLVSLLTSVQGQVAYGFMSPMGSKQMPCMTHMLTKTLILAPKIYKEPEQEQMSS